MQQGILGQFALPVSDADRSESFYEDTLGFSKLFRFGDLVFFDCGGVRLMLEGTTNEVVSSDVCHYFKVDTIEDEVSNLQAKGVAFTQLPHMIADMDDHELWMAFFSDPDNHTLALMEERSK